MVVCEKPDEVAETMAANQAHEIIAWNLPLKDAGALKVAEALKSNNHTQKLVLYRCSINAAGAIALAEALETNKTLKEFDWTGNEIGIAGNKKIREVWSRTRLAWSDKIEVSGGRELIPPKFSEKVQIKADTGGPRNVSQFATAMSALQDKGVKGCPPRYKPAPNPKRKVKR
uniref:Uncharacterized protein n=1 Tax=Hemiselmis andersenii TaxID=464988 RepID=A0A6U4Z9E5_HEMAN|mmetsp:Transcript_5517/g.12725  ORF Transcript_5517/g.12725 Transcript_5517/m.12725 type:complete len:172 (+) Transcript_5517:133-648(+)